MFRYLVLPTLIALLLVPDWASAFFRRRTMPCPVVPAQRVQYVYPAAYPCPPMFLAPPVYAVPAAVVPATPQAPKAANPQVVPERMATPKAVAPDVTPPPVVVPRSERLVEPSVPRPNLIPNESSKLLPEPTPVRPEVPVFTETVKPVVAVEEIKLPPTEVPPSPPTLPKLSFDPAPTKDTAPALPKMELPSIDLNSVPPLAVPKEIKVESSPIRAEMAAPAFEMFPVDGAVGEKRIATFYNFTGRDLLLTVDGKLTTLPAKHTVTGTVGTQFTMQVGVGEEHALKMPASAAGVDVVLRK